MGSVPPMGRRCCGSVLRIRADLASGRHILIREALIGDREGMFSSDPSGQTRSPAWGGHWPTYRLAHPTFYIPY
eukprot:1189537-Prorocentrum_minimum.AAC.1